MSEITTNISTPETPLVSVLIPCYNAAAYVEETLHSIIAQTYTNWECIVVDDHSSDNSVEIVQAYCNKYPEKIKLYTNPRKGACAARNVAFQYSRGEYIQYLDADDLLARNKIEKQIQLFKQYGNNIITSCIWGRFTNNTNNVKWENQLIDHDYEEPINWLVDAWNGKGMMAQHGWLVFRDMIVKAKPWNEKLLMNQDGEFFCRLIMQAKAIKFCPEAKVYYRSGNNNIVSKAISYEKIESQLYSYKLYEKVLSLRNDIDIKKALARNYRDFIYRYHPNYNSLINQAETYIENLQLSKLPNTGGKYFIILSKFFGFYNSLKLRAILKTKQNEYR